MSSGKLKGGTILNPVTLVMRARHTLMIKGVGCIYASNPQFKSNILQFHSILLSKHQNSLKIFSLFFSVFLLTFNMVLFVFYTLSTV